MPFDKLIKGYKAFHLNYFRSGKKLFRNLVRDGQNPDTLIIGCSDSRADPAILTNSEPGDMFVVRNVAALVPPYKTDSMHHGTSAALEFAVKQIAVKHIVVMGHSMCGGIRALAERNITRDQFEFLPQWVDIGAPALEHVHKHCTHTEPDARRRALEQQVVLVSLDNLMTFPWVAERVKAKTLELHGWYFDMAEGALMEYNEKTKVFENLHKRSGKNGKQLAS
ncbi:MAG: carbonic anhydrase [Alphaproteobacteria bacterium]